jgi:hypothetical protein
MNRIQSIKPERISQKEGIPLASQLAYYLTSTSFIIGTNLPIYIWHYSYLYYQKLKSAGDGF